MKRNSSLLGDIGEAAFLGEATRRGIGVSRPFSASAPYDFLVEASGKLSRVQVKHTKRFLPSPSGGSFRIACLIGKKNSRSLKGAVDYLAVLVDYGPGYWYIIPIRALKAGRKSVRLYPHRKNPKGFYERYKERWKI